MFKRRIEPTCNFVKRYMVANNVSQKDLAKKTGYSEKQISQILNGSVYVTDRFAKALSDSIAGLKYEFIVKYNEIYKQQEKINGNFLMENDYKNFSKKFCFNKIFKNISLDKVEQIKMLFSAFKITNLNELAKKLNIFTEHINCLYLKDSFKENCNIKNNIAIWSALIIDQLMGDEENKKFIGNSKTLDLLYKNKDLFNVTNSEDLITNIKYFCDLCGIHVCFCKNAPSTYVRGISFYINNQYYIVLTDRLKKIEYVVHSFLHEIYHITNDDLLVSKKSACNKEDLENNANSFADNFIAPDELVGQIKNFNNVSMADLFNLSSECNVSIGLIASRLQRKNKNYKNYWQLLNNFTIDIDVFGN